MEQFSYVPYFSTKKKNHKWEAFNACGSRVLTRAYELEAGAYAFMGKRIVYLSTDGTYFSSLDQQSAHRLPTYFLSA